MPDFKWQMGPPSPQNTTAIVALGNSSGRPPVPICDSQNGPSNSQDQSAILFLFLFFFSSDILAWRYSTVNRLEYIQMTRKSTVIKHLIVRF